MIRIAIIGDIGSGKSFVSKLFEYPVFNADIEVGKLYNKSRKCFNKLKKKIPSYITSFPIKKNEITKAIIANKNNLKKIINVIHPEINFKLKKFENKNKNKKFVILDIPLLIENKINKKNDILIFVSANKKEINKRIKKRKNFNLELFKKFKKIQLPIEFKKKKSHFIITNNFKVKPVKKSVKILIKKLC